MGNYCKHNSSRYNDALVKEAQGLEVLRAALSDTPLNVPEVFSVDAHKLELTAIEASAWSDVSWARLGSGLAELHRQQQPQYGSAEDNYIGLNQQRNGWSDDWGDFFVERRLREQIAMITDKAIRRRFANQLEQHAQKLTDYLNRHCDFPSLLHGDLWTGNALCDVNEEVWLIDPAVYCGDREVDIAMMELFGGFGTAAFQAYDKSLPRTSEYKTKRVIYNLYHYLNHYNLFGANYLTGCEAGLQAIAALPD